MNPELEARLRRFGARVDAAAEEAAARHSVVPLHRPPGDQRAAIVPDLEPVVVPLRRPGRLFRALAVSAAAVAAAVTVGVLVIRDTDNDIDRTFASGADSATAVSSSVPEPTTTAPQRLPTRPAPTLATDTTASPTTTTSSTTSVPAQVERAATTTPRVCPSYRPNESLPLKLCDQGDLVRQVQQRLAESVAPRLSADGYFGPATREAVLAFQRQHGLEVDGYVGPDTVTALFAGSVPSPPEV